MKVITSIDDALSLVGQELGVSDWLQIDQQRIDAFAEATGDRQWIHVDVDRANAESPYGAPIAHGFLTLSLIPVLRQKSDCPRPDGVKMGVNYGGNKVRFLAPVKIGDVVRVHVEVAELFESRQRARLVCECAVDATIVLDGEALVRVPSRAELSSAA